LAAAKKKRSRRTSQAIRDGQRQGIPGWIWLLLGMVMGLGLAIFLMIAGLMPQGRDGKPAPVPQPDAAAASPAEEELAGDGDEPEWKPSYDFYTVLPEMEVVVPEDEINQRVERREEAAAGRGPYVLQVGSFRDYEDADRTKAELALLGFLAEVKTVTINESTWHRVRIGPYSSVREMDVVRRQLQQNRYDVLVLNERK
jgi:cell division protein FtsN